MKQPTLQDFNRLVEEKDLEKIKEELKYIINDFEQSKKTEFRFSENGASSIVSKDFILDELDQIIKTRTIERTRYYLKRFIKSLSEVKTRKTNDINLNRWKEYDDIITDSLWIIDKRDQSGAHKAVYWGNFIPQIPNQFLRRYTKKGDWILDPFVGSGTTLIECRRLGRNGIGIELNPAVAKLARENLKREQNPYKIRTKVLTGDSTSIDYYSELEKGKINSVQFLLLHPPYWDIITFSKRKNDLSNAKSVGDFLEMFGSVAKETYPLLDKGRYCAVVIGDKYSSGEWIPLGFFVMQEMIKRGYKLKSTIVKNFDATRGKMNQKELWRYRALAGGFYIFKHEYIFLFQK
ncbi:MAG: DNA methyltransferase [Ignavibacterium sp.]|nr:MAG: DNA methyltransferase [Ignavibacterium sp.]